MSTKDRRYYLYKTSTKWGKITEFLSKTIERSPFNHVLAVTTADKKPFFLKSDFTLVGSIKEVIEKKVIPSTKGITISKVCCNNQNSCDGILLEYYKKHKKQPVLLKKNTGFNL